MGPDFFDSKGIRRTIACGPNIPTDTWKRAVFDDDGCTIHAWPSGSGVFIKENADVIDMAFLGFDCFASPTRCFPDVEQEKGDDFARTLLTIGATFWESQRRYADVGAGAKEPEGKERMRRFFGWEPWDGSGVAWALEFDVDEVEPPATARLRMAVTMEERCTVLQKLGAKFYEDREQCPGLKWAYDDVLCF